jgi:hypothetical protein
MSKAVTELAADLGSFNNVSTDEVFGALQSGLLGESEPMRRFGANLSAARVEAYALASGMVKTKKEITDAVKVQARYALILKDTSNAQGDFGRTAEGTANKTRILNAQIVNMQTEFGKLAKGAGDAFLGFLATVVNAFIPHDAAVKKATDYINSYGVALEEAGDKGEGVVEALKVTAIEAYTAAWQDWMDVNQQFLTDTDNSGQTLAMMERLTMDMAMASGVGAAELAVLAEKVRLAGGDYDDLIAAIQGMIGTGIDLRAMAMRYVSDVKAMGGATTVVVKRMREFSSEAPKLMTHAVVDMKAAIKSGKEGII